ncbi:MAG TPA: hypothetical protein VJK25_01070 [Patescibacteria group bacterium]|nr:hypothetical protein [Patescibacteria group bacterium]
MLFKLFKSRLVKEVFISHFNKLPDTIKIDWLREGNFLVGTINADNEEYCFQALSAKEFVDTVNNILFEANNIPLEYQKELLKNGRFMPDKEELEKLNNFAIKKSELSLEKNLQEQPA